MKNKKLIIGIILALVIIAIAVYFYVKSKKKTVSPAANILNPDLDLKTTSDNTGIKNSQVDSVITESKKSDLSPNAGMFTRVMEDAGNKGSILRYEPATMVIEGRLKTNDSIAIPDGPYAGTHQIYYIYDGTRSGEPKVRNLYIRTAFKGDIKGMFAKV